MRISLPALAIGDEEGFSSGKDIFGLKPLGDGMTNLIANVDDSLVIAFDGQWGTGKTTFLRMWAGELRKLGYPTIFFDAFENDYVEDAFAALVREVTALVESKRDLASSAIEGFKEKAIRLGRLIGLAGVKIGVKVAVRAATAGLASATDVGAAIEEVTDASGDVAEKYMEEILTEPNKQKQTVQSFRDVLSSLPALLAPPAKDENQKPLVFIIDELDRCKPIFALQMLERIKHFLTTPNIHFVLGVQLSQLENSVKVTYGQDIDATTYLQKFINLTIAHVDTSANPQGMQIVRFTEHLKKSLNFKPEDGSTLGDIVDFLRSVALHSNMSLRTLERVFSHIAVCLAFTGRNQYRPGPLIAGLCILKVVAPDLYAKAKKGQLRYDEIAPVFGFSSPLPVDAEYGNRWAQGLWQYCLLDELPEDLPDFRGEQFRFNLPSDRKRHLPIIANAVVDRLILPA